MSGELAKSEPLVKTEGFCIETTRGWYRRPGIYPCQHVLNIIGSEVVTDGESGERSSKTTIQSFRCPLRLEVHDTIDEELSISGSKAIGEPVEIHASTMIGPEEPNRPGKCVNILPSFEQISLDPAVRQNAGEISNRDRVMRELTQ